MYRVFLLLTIAFLFASCGGDSSASQPAANGAVTTNPESGNSSAPATTSQQTVVQEPAEDHEIPYCRLWVVKMAVETDNAKEYKGRWFNFKKDGSFESGKWGETTNSGAWSIEKSTNEISLSFAKGEMMASRWKIQGSGGGGPYYLERKCRREQSWYPIDD